MGVAVVRGCTPILWSQGDKGPPPPGCCPHPVSALCPPLSSSPNSSLRAPPHPHCPPSPRPPPCPFWGCSSPPFISPAPPYRPFLFTNTPVPVPPPIPCPLSVPGPHTGVGGLPSILLLRSTVGHPAPGDTRFWGAPCPGDAVGVPTRALASHRAPAHTIWGSHPSPAPQNTAGTLG